jgi:hypothetical protein
MHSARLVCCLLTSENGINPELKLKHTKPKQIVFTAEVLKSNSKVTALLIQYIRKYLKWIAACSVVNGRQKWTNGFPWDKWFDGDVVLAGYPPNVDRVTNPRKWSRNQLELVYNLCLQDQLGPVSPNVEPDAAVGLVSGDVLSDGMEHGGMEHENWEMNGIIARTPMQRPRLPALSEIDFNMDSVYRKH